MTSVEKEEKAENDDDVFNNHQLISVTFLFELDYFLCRYSA